MVESWQEYSWVLMIQIQIGKHMESIRIGENL